jgi:FAD/FMN-containing dehydrogenase
MDVVQARARVRQPDRRRGGAGRRQRRSRKRKRAPRPVLGDPGGGGNFGIVTEFEFRLHPLGPRVLARLQMFAVERALEVMHCWRDIADASPDELATACVTVTAPPEPFVPSELRGRPVLGIAALYVGDPAGGDAVVEPLRQLGVAVDTIAPVPYTGFQAALDPLAQRDRLTESGSRSRR